MTQTSPPARPEPPSPNVPQSPPSAPVVRPAEGGRLDGLLAEFGRLKPQIDDLTEQLKTVTDAIKLEVTSAMPGSTSILLSSPHLRSLLDVNYRAAWRLDTKRLKAEQPLIYATYAKRSGSWRLDPVEG